MLSRTNNGPNRFRVVRVITNSTPVLFRGGRLAELTRMQSPCKRWQPCETLRWSDQTSGGRLADCLCWPELGLHFEPHYLPNHAKQAMFSGGRLAE